MRAVGDFWMQISLRVVEACRASRPTDGGLRSIESLRSEISERSSRSSTSTQSSSSPAQISCPDIILAITLLTPLGSGFSLLKLNGIDFVRSIPATLSSDQLVVLEALQTIGYVSIVILRVNLRWDRVRATTVLEDLLAAGLVWMDRQAEQGPDYYSGNAIKE